ncbi:amidohydrolase family protein [Oculatella sp. LEGE 06141]|uniref:amidohydrolase family protein n=1 Tax=Oculatella sp. LEGE 06141 TaxID=1828648 RepID=UPI0030DD46D2
MSLFIKNGLVLSSADAVPQIADIKIEGNQIVEVGQTTASNSDHVIDASGLLLAPGLINGHFHSHEHFHKGRYDNLPLELWMHFVRPPVGAEPLTPEQVYLRTMIGAIEALRTGTTFVVDDVNHAPWFSQDCIDAVFRAYQDIGLRALVSVSLFDLPFHRSVPFFDEEMPAVIRQPLDTQPPPDRDRLLDLAKHLAHQHHPQRHRVGYIVAPSAPQRCSDTFLLQLHQLAEQQNLPMMMHVLETRLQAVTAGLLYQRSMVAHLAELGILSPRLALQHCVWSTANDIEHLANAGSSAVYNPLSNLKLGSGQMPLRHFIQAGVNVALASDGCGSRDSVNMLSVVQATALLNKSPQTLPAQWLSAEEAFRLGTEGGARAFGYADRLGRIEPGYLADIVGYRLSTPAFIPLNHPLRQLVYAETGCAVDLVVSDGIAVMQHGQLTQINESALIAEILSTHQSLLRSLEASEAAVSQLLPYYRRICDRCRTVPVDPDIVTWDNHPSGSTA